PRRHARATAGPGRAPAQAGCRGRGSRLAGDYGRDDGSSRGAVMSEAAVVTIVTCIVTGAVTMTTTVVGLFVVWLRLKYGMKDIAGKVDHNTQLTKAGTAAAVSNA